MRKRSDVAAAIPADTRTKPMFGQQHEPAIPPREERPPKPRAAPTLTFLTCPSCGLKQSAGSVDQAEGNCMRCEAPMGGAAQDTPAAPPSSPQEAPAARKRGEPAQAAPEPAEGRTGAPTHTAPKTGFRSGPEPAKGGITGEGYETCCPTCLKPLTKTALGNFASCGCPSVNGSKPIAGIKSPTTEHVITKAEFDKRNGVPPVPDRAKLQSLMDPSEFVTVTWGEEMLCIADFCNVKVGPFSATVAIHSGETIERAQHRANSELVVFAEAERERKVESFKRALKKATGQ